MKKRPCERVSLLKHENVLCIYPYRKELGEFGFCPPLGLEYIATAIQDLVEKVTVIDMRFEENVMEFISGDTDVVCISVNWGFEESYFLEIISKIPESIVTIVGGRHATENVLELFESCPNIDIIVRGDGEETVRELLEKRAPQNIAGLSYRENGKITHERTRKHSTMSNTLYPNRKLRRYRYRIAPEGVDLGMEIDTISSSRGCPFNCKFCTFNLNPYGEKRGWSARTPESVIEELKTIRADLVGFTDDNFTQDMDRVERICDLIVKQRIKKAFIANARIDIAKRPDILKKMYRAGFKMLPLGIESTSDKTLKQLNKGFTVAQVREAFKVLSRFNILYHSYFIIGNIGEEEEDMLAISKFAKEIGVDTLALTRLRCEKYSLLKELIKKSDGYHIGRSGRVYSDRYTPERLRQIMRKVNSRFYTLPQIVRILRKLFTNRIVRTKFILRLLLFTFRKLIRRSVMS